MYILIYIGMYKEAFDLVVGGRPFNRISKGELLALFHMHKRNIKMAQFKSLWSAGSYLSLLLYC